MNEPTETDFVDPSTSDTDATGATEPLNEALDTPPESPPTDTQQDASDPDKQAVRGVEKRIGQLTKQRYDALREVANERAARVAAEQRAQWLEAQYKHQNWQTPQPTEYESAQEYAARVHAENQRRAQYDQQYVQHVQASQQQAAMQAQAHVRLQELAAQGQEQYPDFDEVVNNPALPSIASTPPLFQQAYLGLPNAAQVSYFLGKNPNEVRALMAMQLPDAIRELGRISERAKSVPRKSISNAPPPTKTLTGEGNGATRSLYDPQMTAEEWYAAREKQLQNRKR